MYSPVQLARKYLHYYLTASNGRGHCTHSPFVYTFIKKVLQDKKKYPEYEQIESLRKKLLNDGRILEVEDFGAGSAIKNTSRRSVKQIALHAAKRKKIGQLLFRIARFYQPGTIIELGTSLGLSTAYLAAASPNSKLTTLEGATSIAAIAKNNFDILNLLNIKIIPGNFDDTLASVIDSLKHIDLAFIDGNHRKEPTLRYFEELLEKGNNNSLLIFDDIHWSPEMEAAWDAVKKHPASMLTIDLFFMGLVFFRDEFRIKQHFIIRF